MTRHPAQGLALLLQEAAHADLPGVLARLSPPHRADLLRHCGPPPSRLVDWALAHATPADLRALAANSNLDDEALTRLTAVTDGPTLAALYRHERGSTRHRRRMLDADPLADELRELLLDEPRSRRLLGPALDCPHLELAAHAAACIPGLRRGRVPNTPQALYDWCSPPGPYFSADRSLLRGRLALFRLDLWTADDWNAFARLHDDAPLHDSMCRVLVELPEVPQHIALALTHSGNPRDDGAVIRTGLRTGAFSGRELLRGAPDGAHLLRTLEHVDAYYRADDHTGTAPTEFDDLRTELASLVRESLGTDPAHLRTLLALLADGERRTLPALFAAARTLPEPPHKHRPLPDPPPPMRHPLPPKPRTSTSPFFHLLCRVDDPDALRAVLAALDPEDLGELCHYGIRTALPDALVDAFADVAPPEVADAFVAHHGHHPRTQARLLRRDDPRLNDRLLRTYGLKPALWRTVVSGTPHSPGRTEPVPLHPDTLAVLLDDPQTGHTHPVQYAAHARDPDLVLTALRRPVGSLPAGAQIAGCRRLVELGMVAEVAELAQEDGPLDLLVATRIRQTLALVGGAARLGGQLAALAGAQFARDLQSGMPPSHDEYLAWPEPPEWETVLDRLRARRVTFNAVNTLLRRDDLPDEVAHAILRTHKKERWVAEWVVGRSRPLALATLAQFPLPAPKTVLHRRKVWFLPGLRAGHLGVGDILAHGRPALSTLWLAPRMHELAALPSLLDATVTAHGADTPDAWSVVAALLPDFSGTLPELLSVAAAATTVAPVTASVTATVTSSPPTTRPGEPGRTG
ncbi:hypothetical protein [Yinghuangia seranimata]|uniref:hypothetical protein n=1 Tax=Yinghuangia seranimata TaxID=408067 RepID=UPI00248C7D08|nr:hypothetical protein [Yinghuangia seranimata]MDI2127818.1 hypothetical protein [Yinghuangia seranimata]